VAEMSTGTRNILASVLLAGPSLVLWGAPLVPVAAGCVAAALLLLLRERQRQRRKP
jgi:hypothetical protein